MSEKVPFDDFVEQVALESGFDTDTARSYVEDLFETIMEENSKGRWVKLRNFGSFKPKWYKAKRGINPQTQQALDILPHYHINFKSSKDLETILNSDQTLNPIVLETPRSRFFDKLFLLILFIIAVWIVKALMFSSDPAVTPIEFKEPTQSQVLKEDPVEKEVPIDQVDPMENEVAVEVIPEPEDDVLVPMPKGGDKKVLYPGIHTITKDKTLSHIGLEVYESTLYWPLIFTANPRQIRDPDKILNGYTLIIPNKREGTALYHAYMDVHEAYGNVDKMKKSFWILCEGSKLMGDAFQSFLMKKLHPIEYKIIKKCFNE